MNFLPKISLLIAAYNEEACIQDKIHDCLQLNYPSDLLDIVFITDGSTDATPQIVKKYAEVQLLHSDERKGKMAAIDRAVEATESDIIVFTDANTFLNKSSLLHIVEHFNDAQVGMVSGEKRVMSSDQTKGAANEGLYWKYESWLKRLDSNTTTVVGAAGELFAIRRHLFKKLPSDTLLDDFMLSVEVLKAGYRIAYEPNAYALETSSSDLKEEWKRKVRISSGGLQSTLRSFELANFFKYGWTSYTYLVHRIARWTIAPLALLVSFISIWILAIQSSLYLLPAFLGSVLLAQTIHGIYTGEMKAPKLEKPILYFLMMNLSVIVGWFKYTTGRQSVLWDKAKRS